MIEAILAYVYGGLFVSVVFMVPLIGFSYALVFMVIKYRDENG